MLHEHCNTLLPEAYSNYWRLRIFSRIFADFFLLKFINFIIFPSEKNFIISGVYSKKGCWEILYKIQYETFLYFAHACYNMKNSYQLKYFILQELKSRFSGITLLMINTLGICEILHWYPCYVQNMWKKYGNFTRICLHFLPLLYMGWICKNVKSSYTKNITQGGAVN